MSCSIWLVCFSLYVSVFSFCIFSVFYGKVGSQFPVMMWLSLNYFFHYLDVWQLVSCFSWCFTIHLFALGNVWKCSSVILPVNIYVAKWVANKNQVYPYIHVSTFNFPSTWLQQNRPEGDCLLAFSFSCSKQLNKSTLHACHRVRCSFTC